MADEGISEGVQDSSFDFDGLTYAEENNTGDEEIIYEQADEEDEDEEESEESEEEASDEDEDESDEEEEDEDEEEEAPKKSAKDKKPEQKPYEVPDVSKLERPASYDDAKSHYKKHALAAVLHRSGFKIAEDLSNLKQVCAEAIKTDPYGFQQATEFAEKRATEAANQYYAEKIQPYQRAIGEARVAQFIVEFQEVFPDLGDYAQAMEDVSEEVFKKNPRLREDPERAIPILYLKAKEKRLSKVVRKRKAPPLEGGGSRTVKSKKASAPKVGSIFKGQDPLLSIF